MSKLATGTQKKGSSRKVGRNKRKALRRGGKLSAYVRGKISFADYIKG
jgi:hypothetical protein